MACKDNTRTRVTRIGKGKKNCLRERSVNCYDERLFG